MVLVIHSTQELEHHLITMHAQGWSIRALSRYFKMGRVKVRRIIRANQQRRDQGEDILKIKPRRRSKLDGYLGLMQELIEKYPDITGVRMYEELLEAGYTGGKSILNARLRKMRPKAKRRPIIRFETDPGVQGQMDWSPYTIPFRTGKAKVLCFSYILGYSRRQYIDFTVNRKFHTLIRRHQDAFEHFGGVPQTCLYDGEKTVILRWEAGSPVFNPAFAAFITHYLCRPIACPPGCPEYKGKVEAPFLYVEKNALNARTFTDLQDLREFCKWWLANRSDSHIHDTTGRPPLELFLLEEQAALIPLPRHPYDTSEVALRVCRIDGFIEHDTNLYSVPYEYVADILTLKVTEKEVFVYDPHLSLIAHHERKPLGAAKLVEEPAHRKSAKMRYGLEPVRSTFLALGQGAETYLAGLEQKHPRSCGFQARHILRLKKDYHADDIHQAILHALKYYAFEAKAVERILKAKFKPRALEAYKDQQTTRIFEALPPVKQRPLEEYCNFLEE